MKRNMELARTLLARIEGDNQFNGSGGLILKSNEETCLSDYSDEEVSYHLLLLVEAGLVKGNIEFEDVPVISRLTWQGHEFLDDTRDPEIWDKTKERAKALTGVGVALVWELAKAEIKKKLGLSIN